MKTEEAEKILKFIADSLIETKDFALSEAPELIQQLILWKRVQSLATIGLFLIIALFLLILGRFMWSKSKTLSDEGDSSVPSDKELEQIFSGIVHIFSIICFSISFTNFFNSLQIWLAPKIYVLEYCVNMLK